jgi:hypothetical protein
MERFSINMARSFLGRNVNLHLKDGSVIINVQLAEVQKDEFSREKSVKCIPFGSRGAVTVPLRSIAWAELLNLSLIIGRSAELDGMLAS